MKTAVFYRTLKSIRDDQRFEAILSSFPNSISVKIPEYQECDLAVIQGWKKSSKNKDHNAFRRDIIDEQFKNKKHILTVDGNIFDYVCKNTLFRYSIDGIFANTGYYLDERIDLNRWKYIQSITGCRLKPWRKSGKHVLILGQKSSGWTMEEVDPFKWITKTVSDIRLYTDRPIVLRTHPSDIKLRVSYEERCREIGISISENKSITQDLEDAWCSVTYNSSPGATSVIEGVPVFITDPDWKRSPAYRVGSNDLKRIEDPYMPDREEWIQRMSMSHYTVEDIKQGLLWKRVREYLESKK
jgi:hypothetical protein